MTTTLVVHVSSLLDIRGVLLIESSGGFDPGSALISGGGILDQLHDRVHVAIIPLFVTNRSA